MPHNLQYFWEKMKHNWNIFSKFLPLQKYLEISHLTKKEKKLDKWKNLDSQGEWPCYFFTATFLKETSLLINSAYLLCVCVCVCVCVCSVAQLCPTLCNPLDYNLPGASVRGILKQESWSGVLFPPPLLISYSLLNVPESDGPSYHCPQIVHTS